MLKLLLVVVIFAAVTYLVARALQERGSGPVQLPQLKMPRPPRRPTRPARPVAPDDDEEFLRDLDRRRKQSPPPEDT